MFYEPRNKNLLKAYINPIIVCYFYRPEYQLRHMDFNTIKEA